MRRRHWTVSDDLERGNRAGALVRLIPALSVNWRPTGLAIDWRPLNVRILW